MSTAREQVREAVWVYLRGTEESQQSEEIADAASDVWESILRELVEAGREIMLDPDTPRETYYRWCAAEGRAKEALGDH